MESNDTDASQTFDIPQDATVVTQSSWAWIWLVVPWVIFIFVSLYFDAISFGLFPLILALIVTVPGFLRWRHTAYILTEEYFVYLKGSMSGHQRYDFRFTQFNDVRVQPGPFGRTLGYAAVLLALENQGVLILPHVPENSPLVEHFRSRVTISTPPEDEPEE